MGAHIIDGEFQSDKYPSCPRGKVPLSVKDKRVQDLLWVMAQRWRSVDPELTEDLETALKAAGYVPPEESATLDVKSIRAQIRSATTTKDGDWEDAAHYFVRVEAPALCDRIEALETELAACKTELADERFRAADIIKELTGELAAVRSQLSLSEEK